MTPLPLRAGPDDLVGSLLFLCSEASAWMTGQTLVVDGGLVVRY
jgi:NAD(P)-dependent dehydrogenase (short-subunit alcohol dehydrogenase family)